MPWREKPWRFRNWPLRIKMVVLLVCASVLPLVLLTVLDARETRTTIYDEAAQVMSTRADDLAQEIDVFNFGYQRAARKLANAPEVRAYFLAVANARATAGVAAKALMQSQIEADPESRAIGLVEVSSHVALSTDDREIGIDLSGATFMTEALANRTGVANVFVPGNSTTGDAEIAYGAPVHGPDGRVIGVAALWVRARALWNVAHALSGFEGGNNVAIIYDEDGVRIAHTGRSELLFHPAGPIDPQRMALMVQRRVFGANTQQLLQSVRPYAAQFERARAVDPDTRPFFGYAQYSGNTNYGVARRLKTVRWTVFAMTSAQRLDQAVARAVNERLIIASAMLLVALTLGGLFAASFLRPMRALSTATAALRSGKLTARVQLRRADEIGRLGASFDAMAEQIESQSHSLRASNDQLEERVTARTAELLQTTRRLEREVVDRRRAEAALRESEESLATTLDSIGDAVIATDLNGKVVRMNPVAEALTGWRFEDAMGQPLDVVFDIVDEDSRARVPNPVERVLRHGVVVGLANHTALRARDGLERPIADSGAPIRDAEGRVRGVVLVFRDQSEERRMEATRLKSVQLELQNREIQEANRLKSEFLANMSHELRTPLNAIIGFTELIYDGHVPTDAPQYQEFLHDILVSSRHLLQLINDVLDLSKVEAGKLLFHPQSVNLGELLQEVLGILRTSAANKSIDIQSVVDPAVAGAVLDPGRFKQVLYNYLSNALKFTPDRGRIEVRINAEADPTWFRLEVEDTGVGIRSEDLSQLFVEFQQLESGGVRRSAGTGLGLALTRRLVEAQGGSVGASSVVGRGSVFFAVLPRVPLKSHQE